MIELAKKKSFWVKDGTNFGPQEAVLFFFVTLIAFQEPQHCTAPITAVRIVAHNSSKSTGRRKSALNLT